MGNPNRKDKQIERILQRVNSACDFAQTPNQVAHMKKVTYVFLSKAARVFVFGLASVMTPIYLATLGYSPFYVGVAIAAIISGNIFSNIILTWCGNWIGRSRSLLVFSSLMLISGIILFSTTLLPLILLACFLGNISTTGTEAGPFQSIETGVLPNLVSERETNRAFGLYNLIGYGASSIGAFAASTPSYFQNDLLVFRSLYLVYGFVGLLLFILYRKLGNIGSAGTDTGRAGLGDTSAKAKRDLTKLSAFFSIDAFGGGFVSQSLLSYWFYLAYNTSLENLGIIFLAANVITAFSTFGASLVAERLGNLRTMVYTHLLSNVLLIFVPLAGTFAGSVAFLFLRQSVSQMDVPTRQAFMAQVFSDKDRVSANAITNTFRSISSIFGAPISGFLFAVGLSSLPILAGGISKILYDLAIFPAYRKEVK